jgi:hypothetical protein
MKTTRRRFIRTVTYYTRTTIAFATLALAFFMLPPTAQAAEVTIAWNENSENDIAGYKVYYGTASRDHRDYSEILNVGNTTQTTITNLQEGVTYYIAATACDVHNNESAFSD